MLLGRILKKKYPDVHDRSSISLDDLLEWPLWPNFIKIFGTKITSSSMMFISNMNYFILYSEQDKAEARNS